MAIFNDEIKAKIKTIISDTMFVALENSFVGDDYASLRMRQGDAWVDVYIETKHSKTFDDVEGNTHVKAEIIPSINWPACGNTCVEDTQRFSKLIELAIDFCHRVKSELPTSVSTPLYTREENEKRKAAKVARVMQVEVENVLRRLELKNMRLDKSKSFEVHRGGVPVGVYNVTIGNKAYSVVVADEIWEITRIG
jgi:hypothetical protein